MMCCAMPRYAILRYLWHAVLCQAMLRHAVTCYELIKGTCGRQLGTMAV